MDKKYKKFVQIIKSLYPSLNKESCFRNDTLTIYKIIVWSCIHSKLGDL